MRGVAERCHEVQETGCFSDVIKRVFHVMTFFSFINDIRLNSSSRFLFYLLIFLS